MPLIPLQIPPGVFRNGTQYQVGTAGRWFDANLVRWRSGVMIPVGGWAKIDMAAAISGRLRDLHAWRDNAAGRFLGVGSNEGLHVWTNSTVTDITPVNFVAGREDAIVGKGFGFGPFGDSSFGTARVSSDGDLINAAGWSLDNWGENLVACAPHDGRLVEWKLDTATPAEVIPNAPTDCKGVLVTPERHLVALGAGDPRNIAWSSREDNTTWAPQATNTAGSLLLQTNGQIQTALNVRGQSVIWTTEDVHTLDFVGSPLVYGTQKVSSDGGAASPRSVVAVLGGAVWMTENGWFQFDGTVRKLPSDVEDYVIGDINRQQFSKVIGGNNAEFSEAWWFYPSADSLENDRYVAWNYVENTWTIGELPRSAWADAGTFEKPLLAGVDGFIYEHENGWKADGAAIKEQRYAESGAVDLGNGDRVLKATSLLPDEDTQGQTTMTFRARYQPNGPQTDHGPFDLSARTDVRFTGRQVAVRVQGDVDDAWRVGIPRLEAKEGGKR